MLILPKTNPIVCCLLFLLVGFVTVFSSPDFQAVPMLRIEIDDNGNVFLYDLENNVVEKEQDRIPYQENLSVKFDNATKKSKIVSESITTLKQGTSISSSALTLQPNLTRYDGVGQQNGFLYDEETYIVEISASLTNDGEAAASNFRVGYYLSDDEFWSLDDLLIVSQSVNGLATGGVVHQQKSVNLANIVELTPGAYFIIYFIDDLEQVEEYDEDDNLNLFTPAINYSPVEEKPNLTFYQGSGAENFYDYDQTTHVLAIQSSIQNSGNADAGQFRIGYYLSKDTIINQTDPLVASKTHSALGASYYVNLNVSVNLDKVTGLTAGLYYVSFFVDDLDQIEESNEEDNAFYYSNPIDYAGPIKKQPRIRVSPTELTITEN